MRAVVTRMRGLKVYKTIVSGFAKAYAGVADLLGNALDRVVAARPQITLWLLIIGFAMCAISLTANFGIITFTGNLTNGLNAFRGSPNGSVAGKQVGYVWALNWSLFSTFIAPAIAWFGIGALEALDRTLKTLCERGMLRDKEFKRLDFEVLQQKWESHLRKSRVMFVFVFLMVFYVIMSDWWNVVAGPILNSGGVSQTVADPVMEFDWSVASLYPGSHVNSLGLLIFGFVAYVIFAACVPALVIAATLCVVFFMLFLVSARLEDGSQVHFAAVPTDDGADHHFGFKVFSELFQNFLTMSLLILGGLWLMAVQNVYLRDMSHGDFYSMIVSEYGYLLDVIAKGEFKKIIPWFQEPAARFVYNPQVAFAGLLFPMICITSIIGCWLLLREKARQAKAFSKEPAHLKQLADEHGLTPRELKLQLDNKMDVWPVGWVSEQRLLSLMALLGMSMISYRVIAFPIVIGGGIGLWHLIISFLRTPKKPEE